MWTMNAVFLFFFVRNKAELILPSSIKTENISVSYLYIYRMDLFYIWTRKTIFAVYKLMYFLALLNRKEKKQGA